MFLFLQFQRLEWIDFNPVGELHILVGSFLLGDIRSDLIDQYTTRTNETRVRSIYLTIVCLLNASYEVCVTKDQRGDRR